MNRDDSFRMIPPDLADCIVFCASLAVLIFFALAGALFLLATLLAQFAGWAADQLLRLVRSLPVPPSASDHPTHPRRNP